MSSSAQCDVKTGQMPAEINFESPTASTLDLVLDVRDGDGEATLIAQPRKGSPGTIEQLVGRYERRVFRLARTSPTITKTPRKLSGMRS
jgi:hypothetical protein